MPLPKQQVMQMEYVNAVKSALLIAKRSGADHAEVAMSNEQGFAVTARQGDVETLEHHHAKGLSITVYLDQRVGSASTTDIKKEAIRATVEKAINIARYSGQDEYAGLADADLMATEYPDLKLYHPWQITPAEAIQKAIECESIARQQDKRITHSEGATIATYDAFHIYGNSHGFIGYYPASLHRLSCGVIARESDQMQRDYEYTVARKAESLDDLVLVAKHAAEKTVRRLHARKVKTQQCPVIFHAPVAKGLLSAFISAISGRNLYTKASFLLNHLHEMVFPKDINIYQQPHLLTGIGSVPFDAEGVSTHDRHYIENGVLVSYVLNSYSGRKLGMPTTANSGGVFNLGISHGDLNLQNLCKKMGTGLLVTELMGQGVNIMTGDYSRGASGFWVENGDVQYPVEEITIAGNLRNIFLGVQAVSNDVDRRGNIQTGSILIDQMMVAGN